MDLSCLTNLLAFLESVTKSVDDGHNVDVMFLDLELVTKSVDDGHNVDVMFLDFAKAFDKVPHHRLLMKLKSHGVNGKVYNWIQAHMAERSETTCVLEWLSLVMVGCNKWRPTRLGARSDTLPHLHQRHRLQNRQPVNEVCR